MTDRPKIETLKLRTNLPVVLTLSHVYYSAGKDWKDPETDKTKKLPATLALMGKPFGTQATVKVYVPLECGKALTEHGWLSKTGEKDKYGGPAFQVHGSPTIRILREEDGKRKTTTITPADEAPAVGVLTASAGITVGQPAQKPPERAPAPPHALTFETLGNRYKAALDAVCKAYKEAGLGAPNAEQLHAGAACVFIEASRQGITP